MNLMMDKLGALGPEITMVTGACLCLATGLSRLTMLRRATVWLAGITLLVAALIAYQSSEATVLARYIKLATSGLGFLLLLVSASLPDELERTEDPDVSFDPRRAVSGEFFAFFLFSLTGVMLCGGASDLVSLLLALELTSLPTYIMIAMSRHRLTAQEAALKYFFLSAVAVAVFLYGFALIYGATGFTEFDRIREASDRAPKLFLTGIVLAVVGICFKIAAVPMHYYVADVYQGAATPVTAFLAFVPKAAGFVALILLLELVGSPMPRELTWLLWFIAVLTMTVGNVLGLLQSNVKRTLAYSSTAHSGYMLVGLLVGRTEVPLLVNSGLNNGVAAVLFYLVAYGLATLGAFAVLACLESQEQEADTCADLSGLARHNPGLAAIMLVCLLSLIGLPPSVGFIGKVHLFGAALTIRSADRMVVSLVIIAVINSAISAAYYLRIAGACFFGAPKEDVHPRPPKARMLGAAIAAFAALLLGFGGGPLVDAARDAASSDPSPVATPTHAPKTTSVESMKSRATDLR